MNKKNTRKLILIAMVLVVILIGIIFAIWKGKKFEKNFSSPFGINGKDTNLKNFENSVVFWTDDEIGKFDLDSGKEQSAGALEKEDFAEFSGLPKESENEKISVQQILSVLSKDKSKAIINVVQYDLAAQPSAFDGAQSSLGSKEFTCDIVKKKCEESKLLSQSYAGIDSKLQENYGGLWFEKWDSEKNLLYAHLSGEGVGSASPVFVCDTVQKECKKTEGYDSLKDGEIHARVPEGAFSPSLEKFVMVNQNDNLSDKTGKKWEFLLYSSDDLSKPIKNIDISAIIDSDPNVDYDSVHSVAWSADEKKIAIGTSRRIFLLDTEKESLSLSYIASINESGEFYWDFNALFLSPDASTIIFVDEGETIDNSSDDSDEADMTQINVLKKIDLKNKNKVTELMRAPGLSLKL